MIRLRLVLTTISALLCALPSHAQQSSVRADNFGIAIGGNVTNATIIAGISQDKVDELIRERTRPFEELTAAQRETIVLLRQTLDLNQRQIYSALEVLGEAAIPPEKVAAKLVEMAEHLKQLRNVAAVSPGDDPETTSFKRQAEEAISNGDLALADAVLAKAEDRQRRTVEKLALNVANTLGQRGKIALTRLRYLEAAQLFDQAVALIPPDDQNHQLRKQYLELKAAALYNEGSEHGDTKAAASAVDQFRQLLDLETGDNSLIARARLTYALARSLLILSYRDGDLQHLREAIAALRSVLDQSGKTEALPLRILLRQQLAITLTALGVFESNAAFLSEAADLFRSGLSDDYFRQSKALTGEAQGALGVALSALNTVKPDEKIEVEAVEIMRKSIANFDPEDQAIDWSRANAFLGVILAKIGLQRKDNAVLSEAVAYFRASLTKMPRERLPLDWAQIQMTLGTALLWLGEGMKSSYMLDQSVEAFKAAHQIVTAANSPSDWASTNHSLGGALLELGKITGDRRFLVDATTKFDIALSMRARVPHSLDWNETLRRSKEARRLLAKNNASKKK